MKQKLYLLILVASFLFSEGMGQITFQRTFGSTDEEFALSTLQTTDGGYIVSGGRPVFATGEKDAWLIKLDSIGDTLWTKRYGGSGYDSGGPVQQTNDGGYVFTGQTGSFGGGYDVWLVKTDANGNISIAKTYGEAGYSDAGGVVEQTNDGGYIVAGYTDNYGFAGSNLIYLIKTDVGGDIQWTNVFGKDNIDDWDFAFSIQQTTDGGYILLGWNYNNWTVVNSTYLIKLAPNGAPQWTKIYEGVSPGTVMQTSDGGYIVSGTYLIKTDANGVTQWSKTFTMGNDTVGGSCVYQTTDKGYIVAGYAPNLGHGNLDAYLIKTDSLGITQWSKAYGGPEEEYISSVKQTNDGGYITCGRTNSFGAGGYDFYVIKTDQNGNSGCNEIATNFISGNVTLTMGSGIIQNSGGAQNNISPTTKSIFAEVNNPCIPDNIHEASRVPNGPSITIYPNPFTDRTGVEISNIEQGMPNVEFALYDAFGRTLQRFEVLHATFDIHRNGLPAGIYFYSLQSKEQQLGRGKLVIY